MTGSEEQSSERYRDNGQQETMGRPLAEWITLGISIGIIATVLSLVTWLYVRGAEEAPRITVDVMLTDVREDDGMFYVPLEIANEGDSTVANANVEGELDTGNGQPQTAEVTIDYLAGGERERATLVFDSDPRGGDLTVGPTSFQDP